jgi:hypothetical protein
MQNCPDASTGSPSESGSQPAATVLGRDWIVRFLGSRRMGAELPRIPLAPRERAVVRFKRGNDK